MKLFRGLSTDVWRKRLQSVGWPPEAADSMALWLTEGKTSCLPNGLNSLTGECLSQRPHYQLGTHLMSKRWMPF